MQSRPEIGVVGTFIRDRIITLEGRSVDSIGGLYHSVAYLCFLAGNDFRIVPLARVGQDFWPELQSAFSELPGLDAQHLIVAPQENTRVKLIYKSATERDEVTTEPMPPLGICEVKGLAAVKGILVNMISGEDLQLSALQWLARETAASLYFDLHTLALGRDAAGRRFYRMPPDWQDWIACGDFLQLNRDEARLLAGLPAGSGVEAFHDFLESLLRLGPQGVLLTLGREGVVAAFRDRSQVTKIRKLAPKSVSGRPVDVIGCGDAFGAAFLAHYLRRGDFFEAAQFATTIATLNTTFLGSLTREQFEENIKHYANFTT